jgi:hypothetical protein
VLATIQTPLDGQQATTDEVSQCESDDAEHAGACGARQPAWPPATAHTALEAPQSTGRSRPLVQRTAFVPSQRSTKVVASQRTSTVRMQRGAPPITAQRPGTFCALPPVMTRTEEQSSASCRQVDDGHFVNDVGVVQVVAAMSGSHVGAPVGEQSKRVPQADWQDFPAPHVCVIS